MGNSSDDLAIGTRVGDYQILGRLVGRGPALAYEAIHVMLPRRVVLKVMPAYDVRASGAGLLREACIVESIEHPGVPRLYECGVLPDRRAWIAFELVAGESLARTSRLCACQGIFSLPFGPPSFGKSSSTVTHVAL